MGQSVEQVEMRPQNRARPGEAFIQEAPDLIVDQLAHVLRVVPLLADVAPEEDHLLLATEGDGPESLAHAEYFDHAAHDRGGTLDVLAATRAQLSEHDGFSRVSTKRGSHRVDTLTPCLVHALFGGLKSCRA